MNKNTPTTEQVNKLAKEYSRVLRSWLSEGEMQEIIHLNGTPEYKRLDATHNYCDPNQAALDAFPIVFGREPEISGDINDDDHSDTKAIFDAMGIAKQNGFYIQNSCPVS